MAGRNSALILVRLLVSAVFLISGGLKLVDPGRFLLDVRSFELLPYSLAYATALALPWLEILAALGLWWRGLASGSAFLLAVATMSFLAAIALATLGGVSLDCGCFGDWLVFPNIATHVAFNSGLLAGCLVLLRFSPPAFTRPAPARRK